jgi:predicted Zn-dependent peptidase
VVSYQVHYAVGSRNERPGITGIAHLFEHMMFKGTPRMGPEELARTIQAHGGQINAFTTEDSTCYYENLPSSELELAVDLEADRQANLLLTEENLASEREVVRNERLLRTVNTPYGLARELLCSLAFQCHPYSWPVVGWDSDLVALSLDDCRAFFASGYAASNTTIVVAGDAHPDRVLDLVRRAYELLPAAPPPRPVVTREEPQRGERRGIFRKPVEAAGIFAGFHVPALTHADTPPLVVLAALLSEGESSRLYRRFVHAGRAGMVHAEVGLSFLNRDPSLLRLEAVANPGEDPGDLEAGLWEEMDRLCQEPVSTVELARAVRHLRAGFVLQAQTQFQRGLMLGLGQVRADDWRFASRTLAAYDAVRPDDIMRVARAYLLPDNRTVVLALPEA